MACRSKCEISADVLQDLVRTHVKNLDSGLYNVEDLEVLALEYESLLCAIGRHTMRLSVSLISTAAAKVFGVNQIQARKFGSAISSCLSYCVTKMKKSTGGKKMSQPVAKICASFQAGSPIKGTAKASPPAVPPPTPLKSSLLSPTKAKRIYDLMSETPTKKLRRLRRKTSLEDIVNSPISVNTSPCSSRVVLATAPCFRILFAVSLFLVRILTRTFLVSSTKDTFIDVAGVRSS